MSATVSMSQEEIRHRQRGADDAPCGLCDDTGRRDDDRICRCVSTNRDQSAATPSGPGESAGSGASAGATPGASGGMPQAALDGPPGSATLGGAGHALFAVQVSGRPDLLLIFGEREAAEAVRDAAIRGGYDAVLSEEPVCGPPPEGLLLGFERATL